MRRAPCRVTVAPSLWPARKRALRLPQRLRSVRAAMIEEALVFGTQQNADERGRDIRQAHPRQAPPALIDAQLLDRLAVTVEQYGFGGDKLPLNLVVSRQREAKRSNQCEHHAQ